MRGENGKASIASLRESLIACFKGDVGGLATKAGRANETEGHQQARKYLLSRLHALAALPYRSDSFELPYGKPGQDFVNVVAKLPGSQPQLAPIMVSSHYDTCGMMPGANDNASAIAVNLALIETLAGEPRQRDIVFAFFDSEEPPYFLQPAMGSIRFYEDQMLAPPQALINMDMVANDTIIPGLENALLVAGFDTDPQLAKLVADAPADSITPIPVRGAVCEQLSDHYVFAKNEHPYVFLTCGRWLHYHSPTDTPEKLNYDKLAGVYEFALALVRQLGETQLQGPFRNEEFRKHEVDLLRRNCLPAFKAAGLLDDINESTDIDALTQSILSKYRLAF